MSQAGSFLIEETVVHPLPQQVDDLLLHQPVSLELSVGLLPADHITVERKRTEQVRLPADNVLSVAILDTGDSVEPPVVPGVGLGLQRIHNGLAKPVDRTEHYGVHRSEQGKVCMNVRLNIFLPDLM